MTRDTVMKALTYRFIQAHRKRIRIVGAPRFKWLGTNAVRNYVIYRDGSLYEFRTWSEVESCVASMIAAQPAVAKVL